MTKKGFFAALGLAGALTGISAQSVTLDQAVQEALTKGADQAVWSANLAASRAAEAAARARAGLTLSTNLGYSASETWSDPVKDSDSTLPYTATAGVTLATPLTSVTVRGGRSLSAPSSGGTLLSDSGSATLSQVLWNGYPGGAAQAAAEKAALTLKTAELNAQANRNKLIFTVKQAFFTLLSAQESLTQLAQTQVQRAETAKFAQTKFTLGQLTALDLKQASINARTADLDLAAGQSALEAARRRLANLMGRPDTDTFTVAAEADPAISAATLDDAVALALRQRVEPLAAQAAARSAEIDAFSAFGSATPSVTLTGGVTVTQNRAPSETSSLVGNLGVTVGAPLWDAGLASAMQAQANSQKTAAQVQFQQLTKSIPVDVTEAWNTWQLNGGRLEVAVLALEVAEGQRVVAQAQFDAGLKTLSDLQTADIALSTAQLALLKAKITAQLSALTLQSLMGQ